jgi:hypothetical protein
MASAAKKMGCYVVDIIPKTKKPRRNAAFWSAMHKYSSLGGGGAFMKKFDSYAMPFPFLA